MKIVCCAVCSAWGIGEAERKGKWFCRRCTALIVAQYQVAAALGYHPN